MGITKSTSQAVRSSLRRRIEFTLGSFLLARLPYPRRKNIARNQTAATTAAPIATGADTNFDLRKPFSGATIVITATARASDVGLAVDQLRLNPAPIHQHESNQLRPTITLKRF